MAAGQTHIIRKQNVRVNAAVHDAFALKRKIEVLMEDLTPKLSELFDGLIAENEWLEIDRLDINIDDIKEHELDEQLLQRILRSIRDKIDARKYNAIMVDGASGAEDIHFISVHEKTIRAMLYFLKNGILPWWFETTSHANFEERLVKAFEVFVWNGNSENKQQILTDLLLALRSPVAQQRLTEQFNDEVYLSVVQVLSIKFDATAYNEVKVILDRVIEVLNRRESDRQQIDLPEIKSQQNAVKQTIKQVKQDLLAYLLMVDSSINTVVKSLVLDVYRSLGDHSLNIEQKRLVEDTILKGYLPELPKQEAIEPIVPAIVENKGVDTGDDHEDVMISQVKKSLTEALKSDVVHTEGAIIANAGLILVAPFLGHLFGQCGVLADNVITDVNKAIAILHYIAYKNCVYREYDVLLNKVLCGMDDNQPITLVDELPEADKDEVEVMLSTAISYWTVLKNTSPDGLREGFLVRKGNLHHKYDDWFLHVEQSSIDALLQQLPWTIGFIKLPWMKKMIRTQWI